MQLAHHGQSIDLQISYLENPEKKNPERQSNSGVARQLAFRRWPSSSGVVSKPLLAYLGTLSR